jgi:type I restriction enzyme, S subunit
MSKWEMIKLGDITTIISGSTPKTSVKEYWDGTNYWVTPAELSDDVIFVYGTERKITDLAVKETSLKLLPIGTVLLSSRAPIGKVAIVGSTMYCNQGFKNLICGEKIYNKYLYWFLKGKKEYLNSLGRGATFKEISKTIVEKIEIPHAPLDIQKHISDTLDKTQEIIDCYKKQLEELDNLIKAIFYDMFGDLVINEKSWEVKKLGDLCNKITDGKHGDCENEDNSGYYFISAKDIVNGEIVYNNARQITYKDFIETDKRTGLIVGDVIVVNTGATIGKTALTKMNDKVRQTTFQKSVGIIQANNTMLNNVYLQQYIIIDRDNIYNNASGSAQKNWLLSQMRNYSIMLPPLDLQTKFSEIVTKIEEQRTIVKQSIAESQNLMNSLMSKYFD